MFREVLDHVRVPEAAAMSCASAGGAVLSTLGDVSMQIAGVPLPVFSAAAAGAFLLIAFMELSALRAMAVFLAMTAAGCAGSPLLQAVSVALSKRFLDLDLTVAGGWQALAAGLIASSPLWVPRVWPLIKPYLPAGRAGVTGSTTGGKE